ncbi:cytochrome b/b6 domain-containing protein [Acidithiobacillus sp. CV18-2]|uniref:Cytochrome b/b6 domain-containing protein n=1 Tax=Igneacidithiobacillus copahuensis TaxID=2724909 RepID=A0AAE3CKK1_9PROT|nr:cytochrome b/b6 domain-containing protein [Igneacidithiobacillus copahuensis]MBU2753170.1 cytochrome b/b6 domain-containing protein [Acidithiobacillus sp. CV18-3]MBU2757715.1 cytochrome b/b6 domain-containing protein [Acidithiobacillus sp. BN09-2]MBU2778321.1 cytochrome b/b6 domain-containing protein [Acidithiobacillus sp. CV18-2]MBU2795813.1 cytochrome b/b6 domain-containing protein [Acidithiobacillus sp. VAN18-2]MBU2799965.1 cytochrome b/b6 domain-containing protein [Acidithiobacillus sp.
MEESAWPSQLKWLHAALAVLVTFQLFSQLKMHAIWKHVGVAPYQHVLYWAHMLLGTMTFLVILLFWHQIFLSRDLRLHLFPYVGVHRGRIWDDLRHSLRGVLPEGGMRGGLPGLVHGLGILVVTAMGLSGILMFYLILSAHGVKPAATYYEFPKSIHSLVANLLWAYWGGHIAMALLHALKNPRILRIFVPGI